MTDRILDEIVSDLTPYGYKEIINPTVETYSIGVEELDNKKKYARTGEVSTFAINESGSKDVIYSHDVLADIMLNGDKAISSKIITEVDIKTGKNVMTEFYLKERKAKRRMLLLSRKTIVRAGQRITKAIAENRVDMKIIKEDVEQFLKQATKRK